MIEIGTWLAVGVLGPGAFLIFIWFLFDAARLFRPRRDTGSEDSAPDSRR